MDRHDLQLEELGIAEAVGLSVHGFDFVVGALHRACRDAVVVVGEDALVVVLQRVRELDEHLHLRREGPRDPVVEQKLRRRLAALTPYLTQILLHVVGQRQRRVQISACLAAPTGEFRSF